MSKIQTQTVAQLGTGYIFISDSQDVDTIKQTYQNQAPQVLDCDSFFVQTDIENCEYRYVLGIPGIVPYLCKFIIPIVVAGDICTYREDFGEYHTTPTNV